MEGCSFPSLHRSFSLSRLAEPFAKKVSEGRTQSSLSTDEHSTGVLTLLFHMAFSSILGASSRAAEYYGTEADQSSCQTAPFMIKLRHPRPGSDAPKRTRRTRRCPQGRPCRPHPRPRSPLTAGPGRAEPPAQRRHPRPQRRRRHGGPRRGPSAQAQQRGPGGGTGSGRGSGTGGLGGVAAARPRPGHPARDTRPPIPPGHRRLPALRALLAGIAVLGLCGCERSFITDGCGVCSALSVPREETLCLQNLRDQFTAWKV